MKTDNTLGAIFIGVFASTYLSGALTLQVILYFREYAASDSNLIRIGVLCLWILDTTHLVMAAVATWIYMASHWRLEGAHSVDYIPWQIAVTVALTALITFLVQWVRLKSFSGFVEHYGWVFTLGLSLATMGDVVITISLLVVLRVNRLRCTPSTALVLDAVALYTVQTGTVTSVTTAISLICWVTMPHNFIFMGLHFTISKLYCNSVLANLNTRQALRDRQTVTVARPLMNSGEINFALELIPRGVPPTSGLSSIETPEVCLSKSLSSNDNLRCSIRNARSET
ncbi:hypothetical protein NLI96_g1913 [Meripilus lineatus]|uniref:DUF6534 domain-containing protein n=1 Tax=Meripilus lineatus TaxID=2056292 RepID=A0AAD5VF30_9APHY|nr:hypothetical protein NLI96_g1913 [Physisporinus lineatus]